MSYIYYVTTSYMYFNVYYVTTSGLLLNFAHIDGLSALFTHEHLGIEMVVEVCALRGLRQRQISSQQGVCRYNLFH